jgi:hypothetical protein
MGDLPRAEAARRLPKSLPAADVEALRLFMDSRFAEQDALDLLSLDSLKNEVLVALFGQETVPEGLGWDLARMFRDPDHDEVWRDYCIQFVGEYYQRRLAGAPDTDPEKQTVLSAYWEAAAMTDKAIAGTAVNALERLSRDVPGLDRGRIAEAALAMARNERACEAARVTAIQVCSRLSCDDVLPTARSIMNSKESAILRMSAIAAVGDLGGAADVQRLSELSGAADVRVRTAAGAALRRLNGRHGASVVN